MPIKLNCGEIRRSMTDKTNGLLGVVPATPVASSCASRAVPAQPDWITALGFRYDSGWWRTESMPTGSGAGNVTVVYNCPSCGHRHAVQARLVGRRSRCRRCGHVGKIIEAAALHPEPSVYQLAGPPLPVPKPAPMAAPFWEPPATSPRVSRKGVLSKAWSGGAIEESQIQGLAVLLIVLSAADLLMTVTLLHASPRFFEGNPLANWFLARWNVMGLVMFKFGILGGVTVVSEFIERRRPGWGRFILLIGCAGAAYAVITGLRLYMGHMGLGIPVVALE